MDTSESSRRHELRCAEVDLLEVLVQPAFREELRLREKLFLKQPQLRQLRGVGRPDRLPPARARRLQHWAFMCAFVRGQELPDGRRRARQRLGLPGHHVRVEVRWTAHRLTRVVDDHVEAVARRHELAAEGFHARRMAEIQAVDVQPIAPLAEVRLLRVARGRIAGEPGRDDQVRARSQELEAGLVADLHATAGQQRDAPAQIGQLGALREIEVTARRAQPVVEMMNGRVLLLADVAMLRVGRLPPVAVDVARAARQARGLSAETRAARRHSGS